MMVKRINISRLKGQCKRSELPDFVCKYIEGFEKRPHKGEKLENLRLVVFDTETTGLNPQKDRILEIGAVGIQNGEILFEDSFEMLVASQKKPEQESISVHGLLPEEVRVKGIPEEEAVARFLNYIQADVLVAHHANFDFAMIEMAVRRLGIEKFFLFNPKVDTVDIAKKLENPHKPQAYIDSSQYGLDELCDRYDISMEDRHRAWGDALITAKLFLRLAHQLKENGKTQLKHILV